MKILQKSLTIISITILIVCCGVTLLFGWSATGWKALAVPTDSMRPAIQPGSLVLVHRVPISSLKIGDVITYINPLNPKTTLSHRIVKEYLVDGKVPAFVTKGDANKTTDVPITEGSIIGRVVWHVPNVGHWLLEAKKPIIILPIIYAAGLLIMAEEVIRLRDYYKLAQPYILPGFALSNKKLKASKIRFGYITGLSVLIVVASGIVAPTALALLKSNTVTLADNRLSVASTINSCSGNTNNESSINVNNSSNQSSTSGNAVNSENTNGGSATTGNASNSNSSSIAVTVNNC